MICKVEKAKKIIKNKVVKFNEIINLKDFPSKIVKLKGKKFIIDQKSCSIYFEDIIKSKFKISKREDPTYYLKAIKNKVEIKNMIDAHIIDGVALTRFIYWIKNIRKKS